MGLESGAAFTLSPLSSVLASPFRKSMLFLMNFAWASRFRLPLLILVGFMVFDVRMQLEINVDVELRQVHHHHHDSDEESSDDSGESYFDSSDDDDDDDNDVNEDRRGSDLGASVYVRSSV